MTEFEIHKNLIIGLTAPKSEDIVCPPTELIAPKDREIVVDNLLRNIPELQPDQVNRFRTTGQRHDGSSIRLEIAPARPLGSVNDVNEQSRKRIFATLASAIPSAHDLMGSYHHFVRSLIGELCDWCTIDLHEEEGFIRRVAHAHADPEMAPWLERLKRDYPIGVKPNQWIRKTLQKGEVMILNDFTEDKVLSDTSDARFAQIVSTLGTRSVAMIPLKVEGRTVGALTLVWGYSAGSYGDADLPLLNEIADLCSKLVSMVRAFQKAQSELKLREQFLSIASHELKTPLTALQSLIQLLIMKTRNEGPHSRDPNLQMLESAEKQSKRMVKLINDLLDMSRMSAGRLVLKPEPTDLVELVHDVLERLDPQLKTMECEVSLTAPPSVFGMWDRTRLEEVIINLISNAMKYGRNKPIAIEIGSRADRVSFAVQDNGLGIAPADQAKIFDVFERAAQSHDSLGHGLGLYIVRQILDAHHGTIRVQSAAGQGAKFICEIPRN